MIWDRDFKWNSYSFWDDEHNTNSFQGMKELAEMDW